MSSLTRPIWLLIDRLRQWQDARTLDAAHALGRRGEDIAHRYLEKQGYIVVARNWRSRRGLNEVDLVAWQKGEPARLVLAEVKSRRSDEFGAPERNIGAEKMRALRAAAREICHKEFVPEEAVRFDTISIVFEPELKIDHQEDAFSWGRGGAWRN
ncbi:MAG: YraN family protein [Acidobacteriota bacterium]